MALRGASRRHGDQPFARSPINPSTPTQEVPWHHRRHISSCPSISRTTGKTSGLEAADRDALRAVSEWVKSFVARPHKDLGRDGTVCPFVPGSLQATLFAPERIADLDTPQVVELIDDYRRFFLATPPTDGDDAIYKTIIVLFTDSRRRARWPPTGPGRT